MSIMQASLCKGSDPKECIWPQAKAQISDVYTYIYIVDLRKIYRYRTEVNTLKYDTDASTDITWFIANVFCMAMCVGRYCTQVYRLIQYG